MAAGSSSIHLHVDRGLIVNRSQQIIVPSDAEIRTSIIAEAHDTDVGGHLGIRKCVKRVQANFDWDGLVKDVHDHVRTCTKCQRHKGGNQLPAGLMQPIPPPMDKASAISLDFVGPLPRTARGKDFVLVMIDRFSWRVWYSHGQK